MKQETTEVLDIALERLRNGEPISTVVADHPQVGEELSPFLETAQALRLLSAVTMPPPEALREDKNTFVAHLTDLQQQPVSRPAPVRLKGWASRQISEIRATIIPRQQKERRMSALLVKATVIVAIALGTVGGTVAAADASLPGSPVYGVKLSLEEVRLAVATEPEADVELYMRFAQERVREMARLVETGRTADDALLSRLRLHLESALQLAEQMPEEARVRQMARIREAVRDQEQEMARLHEQATEPLRQHLQEARRYLRRIGQEIEDGLREPRGQRWQNMESRPEDAPDPQGTEPKPGGQRNQPDPSAPPAGNGPGPGGPPEQPDDPVCHQNECQPAGDQVQEQHQEQNQEEHHYGQDAEQPGPSGEPQAGNGNGSGNGDAQQGPGPGQDDGGDMGPGPGDGNGEAPHDNGGDGSDGQGDNDGGGGGRHGNR